jgi:hypothetical protein
MSIPANPFALISIAPEEFLMSAARDTQSEGFSHFVASMTAPVASGWSGCRGPCTYWKAPPFHGARQYRTHARPIIERVFGNTAELQLREAER